MIPRSEYSNLALPMDAVERLEPIMPAEAKRRGMAPLTNAGLRTDAFIQSVVADMRRVPGTDWALVNVGGEYVEVWRAGLVFSKDTVLRLRKNDPHPTSLKPDEIITTRPDTQTKPAA